MSPVDTIVERLAAIEAKVDRLLTMLDVSGHRLVSSVDKPASTRLDWGFLHTPDLDPTMLRTIYDTSRAAAMTRETIPSRVHDADLTGVMDTITEGVYSHIRMEPIVNPVASDRIAEAVARVDPAAIVPEPTPSPTVPPEFVRLYFVVKSRIVLVENPREIAILKAHIEACRPLIEGVKAEPRIPGLMIAEAVALAGDRGEIRRAAWAPNRTTNWAEIQIHWHSWFSIFDYVATDWEVVP